MTIKGYKMSDNQTTKDFVESVLAEVGSSTLIAVSKYHSAQEVEKVYGYGARQFGESRVFELKEKAEQLAHLKDISWNFIGHLQTNKVRQLLKIPRLHAIHSVHSLKLLQALLKEECYLASPSCDLFFQVNTSREQEKSGVETIEELNEMISFFMQERPRKFILRGLMTMGSIRTTDFEEDARRCFEELKSMAIQVSKVHAIPQLSLSMGMSDDYKIALKAGSNFIRIGSAIFGSRL